MRIAFITNNYHPYSAGVVRSIDATVKELRKHGNEVLIITLDFLGAKHTDPSYVKRIPSLIRFGYKKKHMAIPWCPKHYMKQFLQNFNPDIVHVHHPFLLGPIARDVAKKMGKPVLFTYHTLYERYVHYVPFPSFIVKPIVTKMVLRFCRSVDEIIAPSSGIKEYLRKHDITNTTIVPSPLRKQFCELPFYKKEGPVYKLICVTRFAKEKNVQILFTVLKNLPEQYRLTLIGYGDQEQLLREQAKSFDDRVQFIIKPPLETIIDKLKQAHLFLFSSTSDTQGIVLAESMACSTPVIAFEGIGQRDIIVDDKNGFIVQNAQAMNDKIVEINSNKELYHALQEGAYKTAKKYCPEEVYAKLISVYQSLL